MKRTQKPLLHFYKKSKKSLDDSVSSSSNVFQNDTGATPETEQTPSRIVISLVNIRSLECLNSKFDIRCYVECKQNLSDEKKVLILQNVWPLDFKSDSPYDNTGKYKPKFQIKWLAYSKLREGSFCKFYVLFLNSSQAGKSSHEKLGTSFKIINHDERCFGIIPDKSILLDGLYI